MILITYLNGIGIGKAVIIQQFDPIFFCQLKLKENKLPFDCSIKTIYIVIIYNTSLYNKIKNNELIHQQI